MHRPHQSMRLLGSSLLLAVGLFAAGCGAGDPPEPAAGDDGPAGTVQQAALHTSVLPSPGVLLPSSSSGGPFSASGRLVLSGTPPFAQPMLRLDDGRIYLLTGAARAACIRHAGERLVVDGVLQGACSSPGVQAVVRVDRLRVDRLREVTR